MESKFDVNTNIDFIIEKSHDGENVKKKKYSKKNLPWYYAVHKGRKSGVFASWEEVKSLVIGFSGAKYKKFASKEMAEQFASTGGEKLIDTIEVDGKKVHVISSEKVEKNSSFSTLFPLKRARNEYEEDSEKPFAKKQKSDHIVEDYLIVYTDGACRDNQNASFARSSYGIYFPNKELQNECGLVPHSEENLYHIHTSPRAELYAIIRSFEIYENNLPALSNKTLYFYTDCIYCINCTRLISKWKRVNWYKEDGEKVKNLDLVKKLDQYIQIFPNTQFRHVHSHYDNHGNVAADALANLALDEYEKSIAENSKKHSFSKSVESSPNL